MAHHQAEPFVKALGPGFHADRCAIREAIRTHRGFNLIYLESMVKLDLFVAKDEPFAQSQQARRVQLELVKGSGRRASAWLACSAGRSTSPGPSRTNLAHRGRQKVSWKPRLAVDAQTRVSLGPLAMDQAGGSGHDERAVAPHRLGARSAPQA